MRASLVPNPDPKSPRISRRTLLKVGVAGGAALLFARWLYTTTSAPPSGAATAGAIDVDARAILAAITPVMLEGALPTGAEAAAARQEALTGVEQAIAGLPPAVRRELEQLFALLAFAPTRCLIAGVWSAWPEAPRESIAGFLASWRASRLGLLRSAYGALHQIIFGAWYGNLRSWPAIGYPGPPRLDLG